MSDLVFSEKKITDSYKLNDANAKEMVQATKKIPIKTNRNAFMAFNHR